MSASSRARNTAIRLARAPIVALVDDDIEVPEGLAAGSGQLRSFWKDLDAAHRSGSAKESGNRGGEALFEAYGGHGHDGRRQEYNRAWLDKHRILLPLWHAGGFGNASIRRSLFDEKLKGGFEELLGAGTPAGSWEDLYFFYRMLKSGYRVLHEPAAYAWHVHRESLAGLEAQLCNYRRGEICFALLLAARYRDPRALTHVFPLAAVMAREAVADGTRPASARTAIDPILADAA